MLVVDVFFGTDFWKSILDSTQEETLELPGGRKQVTGLSKQKHHPSFFLVVGVHPQGST